MIPPEMSYAAWLAEQELQRQRNVALARDYYDGDQKVKLTPRQRQYLGHAESGRFVDNACREVVDAIVDRLVMTGWTSQDAGAATWLGDLYTGMRRLAQIASKVHTAAVRDGESFLVVTIDGDGNRLSDAKLMLVPHNRYVDPQAGGDGQGLMAVYPDDDPEQPMSYAAKRWTGKITNARGQTEAKPRMTLYYPDRVEKYVRETSDESGWRPYQDPGDGGWPIPWLDGRGAPLGIPVGHFRNVESRSELWDITPLQDALNKILLDVLASADTAGFRLLFARGFMPTTDGREPATDNSNLLEISPGVIITSRNPDAGLEAIPPGDLSQLLATYDRIIQRISHVSRTPGELLTRQVQSADSQAERKEPLLAKVRARQVTFGDSWEQVLQVGLRLAATFGGADVDLAADVEVLWEPAEVRDEKAELEALKLKSELGVPTEQLWREMGYTEEEIARMMASPDWQAKQAGMEAATLGMQTLRAAGGMDGRPQIEDRRSAVEE